MGDDLYKDSSLKMLATILGWVIMLVQTTYGKPIYFAILTLSSMGLSEFGIESSKIFVNAFFFFSIFGAWLNTSLCDVTPMKYTAIYHLKMNAKKVVLSEYIYYLAITAITFIPCLLIALAFLDMPFYWAFALTLYVILIKIVAVKFKIFLAIKFNRIEDSNFNFKELGIASIFLIPATLSCVFPVVGYMQILIITAILLIPACLCAVSLWKYPNYAKFYKKLFAYSDILKVKTNRVDLIKKKTGKNIDTSVIIADTDKKGYKYFHYLFVQRHRKLLMSASKVIAIIELIFATILIAVLIFIPESRPEINSGITKVVPFFMYLFLFTNRGQHVTQTMFINCDSSMLTYRFYRQPKVILALFKERLKTNIFVDCINSSVVAIALPLILFFSGGTDNPFEYLLLFVTIIAISVFFSVHHLVMYYVLQPYNANIEMKNPIYTIVTMVLYGVCFAIYTMQIEIVVFGSIFVSFSILYIIIGLILAYKLAPKTFKIK